MYFWKIDNLVRDIAEGKVTEREKVKYFIGTQVVLILGAIIPSSSLNYQWDVIYSLINIVILLYFVNECITINHGVDNRNFIERITIFSFPIFFKILALLLPVAVILAIFSFNKTVENIFSIGLLLIYWIWIKSAFSLLKELKETT